MCLWDLLSVTSGLKTFGSGITSLCCRVSLWGSPVITTSDILGVSSCVSPFSHSFFTWDVLHEYWAPPGDCTIKLFPCLFTTVYGLGSKRVVSLFFLSCCSSTWSPRSTSEYFAFLCLSVYTLLLLFCSLSLSHTPCLTGTSPSSGSLVRIFCPKSNSAELTPVVEWGKLLYAAR